MYPSLNKRQTTGEVLKETNYENGSFVRLIKLDKPYANGVRYAVHETTKSPFCSNGLFCALSLADLKYELMRDNGKADSKIIEN